jgi:adenylosuccinate lyase
VKKGGDRQLLHEKIRVHSMEAAIQVKMHGLKNDLLERIIADGSFQLTKQDIDAVLNVSDFIGRAPEQTIEFIEEYINPLIARGRQFGDVEKIEPRV